MASIKIKLDVRNHVRTHFLCKRLFADSLLQNISNESMFGYVQCDLSVPDELKAKISNFPPIFKIFDITRNVIMESKETYAEENNLLKEPQRILYEASVWPTEHLSHHFSTFTWILGYSIQKFIDLYNTHRVKYSSVSFNLLLLEESVMKFHYLVW